MNKRKQLPLPRFACKPGEMATKRIEEDQWRIDAICREIRDEIVRFQDTLNPVTLAWKDNTGAICAFTNVCSNTGVAVLDVLNLFMLQNERFEFVVDDFQFDLAKFYHKLICSNILDLHKSGAPPYIPVRQDSIEQAIANCQIHHELKDYRSAL
jgi:hypothetical protein